MIAVFYGNEPYTIHHYENVYLSKVANEMDAARFDSFEDAYPFLTTVSLFGNKKAAILNANTLKELDTPLFWLYAKSEMCNDAELVIILNLTTLNKKTRLYEEVSQVAHIVSCLKCNTLNELEIALDGMLDEIRCSMTDDAKKIFLQRLAYLENEDVNLITMANELGNICYLGNPITQEIVLSNTNDYRIGDRFKLISLIQNKNATALFKELDQLKKESDFSAIGTLSLIAREYRLAYKRLLGFSFPYAKLKNVNSAVLLNGLTVINECIRNIKNGIFTDTEALTYACACLLNDMHSV